MHIAEPTTAHRVRHLLTLFITGFPLFACCGIWLAVNWALTDYEPFSTDDVPPEMIEGNAEIKLPATAHEIFSHQEGFREIFIQVRFSMASGDLQPFLRSTHCQQPLAATAPKLRQVHAQDPVWWKPADAERLKECTGGRAGFIQHILVDMSDASEYIVYVSAAQQ